MIESFLCSSKCLSDGISINDDEREYLSKYSSVLGIRVGVPHLTKFDVGGVRRWRGFDIRGLC